MVRQVHEALNKVCDASTYIFCWLSWLSWSSSIYKEALNNFIRIVQKNWYFIIECPLMIKHISLLQCSEDALHGMVDEAHKVLGIFFFLFFVHVAWSWRLFTMVLSASWHPPFLKNVYLEGFWWSPCFLLLLVYGKKGMSVKKYYFLGKIKNLFNKI